jgi:hypothetical protein
MRAPSLLGRPTPRGREAWRVKPDPEVMRFYARAAQAWLDLEALEVSVRFEPPDRLSLGDGCQLRLVRDDSRWQLRQRRGSSWRAYRPARPCLSLVDWLAQVRKVHNLTYKAGTIGREKESKSRFDEHF